MDQNSSKNSSELEEEFFSGSLDEEDISTVECRLFEPDPQFCKVKTHKGVTKDMYIYKVNTGISITGLYYGLIKDSEPIPRWALNRKISKK